MTAGLTPDDLVLMARAGVVRLTLDEWLALDDETREALADASDRVMTGRILSVLSILSSGEAAAEAAGTLDDGQSEEEFHATRAATWAAGLLKGPIE